MSSTKPSSAAVGWFTVLVMLHGCGGASTGDDGGTQGGPGAAIDFDAGARPDGGTLQDGGEPLTDGGQSLPDAGQPDAGPRVSAACLAVLAELGSGIVEAPDGGGRPTGLNSGFVSRATACGFRLAAFDQRATAARWQANWRFGPDATSRYLLDASRVVAADDLLLIAVFDTMPAASAAEVTVIADDKVFCQTVSWAVAWPAAGSGALSSLATLTSARTAVPDTDVATVCNHGRVYRIDVQPFTALTTDLTPFASLFQSAGNGALWSRTVLIDRANGNAGFSIAISTRLLTSGTTPRVQFAGARTTLPAPDGGTDCRGVAIVFDFPYQTGAGPASTSWTVAGVTDPQLCRNRTSNAQVSDGYLLVE
jgi:hypothetical protein